MPRQEDKWKDLQRVNGSGGNAYIGKERLEELADATGLDLGEPIEYKVSHGTSDGRARVFLELRNEGSENGE